MEDLFSVPERKPGIIPARLAVCSSEAESTAAVEDLSSVLKRDSFRQVLFQIIR